jgi:hypothetical protein
MVSLEHSNGTISEFGSRTSMSREVVKWSQIEMDCQSDALGGRAVRGE